MFVRVIAVLLVLALWPGTAELAEAAVHLTEHGDLAHGAGDEHGGTPLGQDEHGCSGAFHLCSCHCAPSVTAALPLALAVVTFEGALVASRVPRDRGGRGLTAPPTRPPIR